MSENNNHKKRVKRKPNTFRIAAYGLGTLIVLICAVIMVTILVREAEKEAVQEPSETTPGLIASEEATEEQQGTEAVSEEVQSEAEESESVSDEAESEISEEQSEENIITEPEDEISEGASEDTASADTDVDLADATSIITNWENIPAGTVIDATNIDFNNIGEYFKAYEISDEVYDYINGKSYQENPDVALSDLRYMKLLHYNFNHELQVGELIVDADLQSDFIGIFTELFQAEYEIQSMYLPDRYWTGDPTSTDSASIDENNTSCFMYRPATGSGKLSKHAYGRAIDINPQQNPYVSYTTGSPVWSHENANDYIDRNTGLPHVITEEDAAYKIFIKYGFTWGGAWTNIKDYQHFQK